MNPRVVLIIQKTDFWLWTISGTLLTDSERRGKRKKERFLQEIAYSMYSLCWSLSAQLWNLPISSLWYYWKIYWLIRKKKENGKKLWKFIYLFILEYIAKKTCSSHLSGSLAGPFTNCETTREIPERTHGSKMLILFKVL